MFSCTCCQTEQQDSLISHAKAQAEAPSALFKGKVVTASLKHTFSLKNADSQSLLHDCPQLPSLQRHHPPSYFICWWKTLSASLALSQEASNFTAPFISSSATSHSLLLPVYQFSDRDGASLWDPLVLSSKTGLVSPSVSMATMLLLHQCVMEEAGLFSGPPGLFRNTLEKTASRCRRCNFFFFFNVKRWLCFFFFAQCFTSNMKCLSKYRFMLSLYPLVKAKI